MEKFTSLLNALAGLAWPAIVFYAFYTLRDDLKKLIGRLRKGKILGQEIELDEQLLQIETTIESMKIVAPAPPNEPAPSQAQGQSERERILAEANVSSLAAFLRVSSILESTVNQFLARSGWHRGKRHLSLKEGFAHLPSEWLGTGIRISVEQFTLLRNRIVHENQTVTDEEIRRAIDIGLELLELVKSYPIEENRVRDLVDIYADADAKKAVQDLKGIRLDTKHPQMPDAIRIFPTTKTWYRPGQLVSWDWNMSLVVGEMYYRDPDDGIVKQAWGGSAEFIGYPLEEN
ncbi:hypothetical protein [Rhizobium sp. SG570]|uniref:hypothetical protein n=1 Tax=Rhizobium sp. SG570 TaxID=2587113 RepID=UPI001447FBFC|nr:hypothetical protein [Rhizobium sp. SG570]NKJ33351.1 hypothetical protein [Rhizobium sp. SG570]